MNEPIDFNRERQRRQAPKPRPPKHWLGYAIILAAALYALVRAWQMVGQSL